jgi:hypothetical protein
LSERTEIHSPSTEKDGQSPRILHGMVALEGEGEARRNQLLRRVDWRFLAGKPQPRCSLVQGEGILAEALRLVSGQVVLTGSFQDSADLAALVNPGKQDIKRAYDSLEPGGVLYVEWYRPQPGGLERLKRRLRDGGFLPAGSYWPWPWPERAAPAFWLPLDSPGGLRYFLDNRPPAPSAWKGLARQGIQTAWQAAYRAGLLAPVCLVAHKPVTAGSQPGPPAESLADRSVGWGLSQDGSDLDWLLLTGGLHSTNKVTGLVFRKGQRTPAYVIKMPRRSLSIPSLEREADLLERVHSRLEQPVEGIPQLVFLDSRGDFPAIGETHLPGAPLYTVMQPDRLGSLALQASHWLVQLVDSGPPQPQSSWWDQLVVPVLDGFEQGYRTVGGESLARAAQKILVKLGPLPRAVEHRDFSPWNIFLSPDGSLSVLDWEGAEPEGLPFGDLIYFLSYWTFFAEKTLDSGQGPASYRRMLVGESPMGKIADACIEEYQQQTGLPSESLRPLRLLTWLRHAVLERKLIENSTSCEPDPELLRNGLFLLLVKTELELDGSG